MSVLHKIVAAVAPPETDEQRKEPRDRARTVAANCDWLGTILDHHLKLEEAFANAKSANDAGSRRAAFKNLATILTGHANAEESVIYPAMVKHGEKSHAMMAYTEQAGAKTEMGLLEGLDPNSEDWCDKLEHIQGAVAHHMYEEEGTWFPELARTASPADNEMIAQRYNEEYGRYVGAGAVL